MVCGFVAWRQLETMQHTIRLRGPWQGCLLSDGHHDQFSFQAPHGLSPQIPADFAGRVRLTRAFHRPTGIDSSDTAVQLEFAISAPAQLLLNDQSLTPHAIDGQHRFDVKSQLRPRNVLTIELAIDREGGPPEFEARLLIDANACARSTRDDGCI